jgi:hypothetical protein
MLISLLQPSPETYDLFDDVCLMAGRKVVYLGIREGIEPFFASLGLVCPDSKQTADFLSEVTLRSDQKVFWAKDAAWEFISPARIQQAFTACKEGKQQLELLEGPHPEHPLLDFALPKNK